MQTGKRRPNLTQSFSCIRTAASAKHPAAQGGTMRFRKRTRKKHACRRAARMQPQNRRDTRPALGRSPCPHHENPPQNTPPRKGGRCVSGKEHEKKHACRRVARMQPQNRRDTRPALGRSPCPHHENPPQNTSPRKGGANFTGRPNESWPGSRRAPLSL